MQKKRDAKSIKSNAGRPLKYKGEETCKLAYKLCLLGTTDALLASIFDVNVNTIHTWKKDYPEFCDALKRGKDQADAEVANSLFRRAVGFKTEEEVFEKIVVDAKDNSDIGTEAYRKKLTRKEIAPDTTAAIFWLKNRQAKLWRDKPLEVMQEEMKNLESLMNGYASAIERYNQSKDKK